MQENKVVHLINDEKEIKIEKRKNKVLKIIAIVLMSLILVGSILFNAFYMYKQGYDDALNHFKPLTLEIENNTHSVRRADINESVQVNDNYLYPNTSFSNIYNSQLLNDYQYNILYTFVDDTTYLYYEFSDNDTIKFKLTNGTLTYIIAIYEYSLNSNNVDYVLQFSSDGYLHYILADTYYANPITNDLFPNLFLNYRPDYTTSTPLLLTIGGNNGAINYDNGYNVGYYEGVNNILTNPNDYGLYTNSQYIQYGENKYNGGYNKGFIDAESGLDSNGFIVLMSTIFNAPYNIFNGFLNFEIFGVNLFNLLSFVFTTTLAFLIVKMIFLKK